VSHIPYISLIIHSQPNFPFPSYSKSQSQKLEFYLPIFVVLLIGSFGIRNILNYCGLYWLETRILVGIVSILPRYERYSIVPTKFLFNFFLVCCVVNVPNNGCVGVYMCCWYIGFHKHFGPIMKSIWHIKWTTITIKIRM